MARIIDPPQGKFDKLLTPLTDGERMVIDLFDANLAPEWEVYVQPHLNGLRPDIVLLHPGIGVAVFEVKDWNLAAMQYYSEPAGSSDPVLMARDKSGKTFSRQSENPINKILLYKDELFDLYCPRLDTRAGFAVITAGLIFPYSLRAEIEGVFGPFRAAHEGMRAYPQYYPLSGKEDVISGNLNAIFPEHIRRSSHVMNSATADDLRGWLKEPFFSQEQRTPLKLDARQRELATTRTETGYRRIRGPAGAGKSVVLAARASSLAAEGKHILIVSFNITLLNYLRDLAVRHQASRSVIRRQIDLLNFHSWCKRVCFDTGHAAEYRSLWASSSDGEELQPEPILNEGLALLMQRLYRENPSAMPKYDAILVDEGQDFLPSWWQALRFALKESGEMILAADKTQNIYARAEAWTEDAMANAGFRGRWSELKISYRLPPAVVPLVSRFAKHFLVEEEVDFPEVEQHDNQLEFSDLFPVELRWVHICEDASALDTCLSELRRMMQRLRKDTAVPDITVLTGVEIGQRLVSLLQSKRVNVLHTFDTNKMNARRKKRAFYQGDARIKATTLHSFKGLEARHLVLIIESVERAEDRALIYTALTRLRRHEAGSALTVVSTCPELLRYGQTWPEFVEL